MYKIIVDNTRRVMVAARKFLCATAGNTALTFGLLAVPVTGVVGASIDYGRGADARALLQAAVDAAALAVANQASLTQSGRQSLANIVVADNLGTWSSQISPSVTETEPGAGTYKVSATASLSTMFLGLAGISSLSVSVSATAVSATSGPNVCILMLSASASPGLLANSNAVINAPNCEIDVASTGNPAATFNSGDNFNVSKLCVAGTQILRNGGTESTLATGCTVAADPFAGKLPTPTVGACTVSNQNYSGNTTLSPGVYCGNFNFNGTGTLTFNPGLYIFKGTSWNINSGWNLSGAGVTFYFADTSYIQINSGVNATLTAPTSGTYANILMYEPTGLSASSFTVDGSGGHSFQGLIYLPSRNITFNSMSNVSSEALTMVVNSLILDNLNWALQSSAYTITAAGGTSSARLTQ